MPRDTPSGSSSILQREKVVLGRKSEQYRAVLTLNRPASHNSLSLQLIQQLKRKELLGLDQSYPVCRVVVLQTAGQEAFFAGHDVVNCRNICNNNNKSSSNKTTTMMMMEKRLRFDGSLKPAVASWLRCRAWQRPWRRAVHFDSRLRYGTGLRDGPIRTFPGITVGLVGSTPLVQQSRAICQQPPPNARPWKCSGRETL